MMMSTLSCRKHLPWSKAPLQYLQVEYPNYIKTKKVTPFSSTDRFLKHITELGKSLQSHQRAILLICFIYDNPGFEIIEKSTNYEEVRAAVDKSIIFLFIICY